MTPPAVTPPVPSLLARLDARDRALFARCTLTTASSAPARWFWMAVTHAGGAACSVLLALAALLLPPLAEVGVLAAASLALSHGVVQAIKRHVVRERPVSADGRPALVRPPDRFSFPSGHAAAAMAVAAAYAAAFPALALPALLLAAFVGFSRVRLGVHYPGDVAAGQAIALATHFLLLAAW